MPQPITKDMTIAEALQIKPQIAGILFAKGMHCIGCSIAASETIAQAASVHGLDVDELIEEVNRD
jgi:hybrid cluster-associated redox disulfide protein